MNKKSTVSEAKWISVAMFIITFALSTDSFVNIIYKSRIIQIFTIVLATVFLVLIALKKFTGYFSKKILSLNLMWIFTIFFVLYKNADLKYGSNVSYIVYYVISMMLMLILIYDEKWIEYFVKFMLLTSIVYAIFTVIFKIVKPLYYYLIPKIYSGAILTQLMQQYEENHMAGIASHYSTNAIYLILGVGIIICNYYDDKYKMVRYSPKYILIFAILIISLLFTGKRGTIIFGVLAIISVFLSEVSILKIKKFMKYSIVFVILVVVISLIIYFIPEIRNGIAGFLRLDTGKTLNDITSGRVDLYTRALDDFRQSPLWGCGWGYYKRKYSYIYSYVGEGFYMDVHNIYIQLLCETGILGFTAFLIPILLTVFNTKRLLRKNSLGVIKLSDEHKKYLKLSLFLQVFFILYGLTGNPLYDYWVFMIYILGVSIFMTVYNSRQLNNIN